MDHSTIRTLLFLTGSSSVERRLEAACSSQKLTSLRPSSYTEKCNGKEPDTENAMTLGIFGSSRRHPRLGATQSGKPALGASQIPWQCWDAPGFKSCHADAYRMAQKECGRSADQYGGMSQCLESLTDHYVLKGAGWFSGLANGCMHLCPEQKAQASAARMPLSPVRGCVPGWTDTECWFCVRSWYSIWSPRNNRWCGPLKLDGMAKELWLNRFKMDHDPGARLFVYSNYQWKEDLSPR